LRGSKKKRLEVGLHTRRKAVGETTTIRSEAKIEDKIEGGGTLEAAQLEYFHSPQEKIPRTRGRKRTWEST